MKRVLVTGASGFIGANLVRRLVRLGHHIHVLLREAEPSWRLRGVFADVRPHMGDVRDAERVKTVVADARPEWIFHLAAHGAYSWQTDVRIIYETNLFGTLNLLEACRRQGFEAFVNTGSSSEYGFRSHGPAETDRPEPNSTYAAAKVAATVYCRHTAQATGLRVPTLRLYSIYGPYEDPNRLLPALVVHGLDGQCPPLVKPAIARDFVYVEDAVDAYLLAASTPTTEAGMIVNVGSGQQTTLRELVDLTANLFPGRAAPLWGTMPARSWDSTSWVADARKIRAALGWEPRYSLAQGLTKFVEWFTLNPEFLQRYRSELQSRRVA